MQAGAKIDLMRALEVFIAAADSGSMTRAASRHESNPTSYSVLVKSVVQRKLAITTVSILRGMAIQHARDLSGRDVDVVITSYPLSELEGLEYHELIHERFLLIGPQKELGPQTSLRDLAARFPMIRYSALPEAGRLIEQHLRRPRLDVPHGHSFDSPEDLFAMIAMGQGWAITAPTHVMHALSDDMPVQLRMLPKQGLSRSIQRLPSLPRPSRAMCGRLRVGKDFLHVCSIGRCGRPGFTASFLALDAAQITVNG